MFLSALSGCSTSTPSPEAAGVKHAQLTFNINKCEPQGPGLYKCPAIDKPICDPSYAGPPVECVRTAKDGSIYVQQLEN